VDVLSAEVDEAAVPLAPPVRPERPAASAAAVEALLDRLRAAARPVIVAGSGVFWGRGWEALRNLVEATGIPCFTVGLARGALSDDHALCFGYADPLLNPAAREVIRRPASWLRLGPMGTVGAAIPFGIAAKLARPEAAVVILIGDGGFAMHGWELHTALRFNAPVIVVVGNDSGWGMERELQAAFYDRTSGVELGPVRYDRVVEGMGGVGVHVTHPADLRPALERATKAGTVACVDVAVRGLASPLTQANIARHRTGR